MAAGRSAPPVPTPAVRGYQPLRVRSDSPVTLTRHDPTVTLTRLQSGIGALLIEAACSEAVGDLRLGVAYQLRDGSSSIAVRADGLATAPKGSARPFVRVHRDRFESVTLDLVQIRDIERVIVFAYSPTGQTLRWAGTATVTTSGQARIESPLSDIPAGVDGSGVLVALSLYNVDGQLVVRGENELVSGSLREACIAFGFDRITWLDDHTPLTR